VKASASTSFAKAVVAVKRRREATIKRLAIATVSDAAIADPDVARRFRHLRVGCPDERCAGYLRRLHGRRGGTFYACVNYHSTGCRQTLSKEQHDLRKADAMLEVIAGDKPSIRILWVIRTKVAPGRFEVRTTLDEPAHTRPSGGLLNRALKKPAPIPSAASGDIRPQRVPQIFLVADGNAGRVAPPSWRICSED